jgi:four helix bundle protein
MNEEQMKKRTKDYGKNTILLCRQLPKNREGRLIGDQIFRSGTSVAANYRAACRAKSRADFIFKLSIVEEADETLFWLEVIKEMKILASPLLDSLIKESNEIIAILVSSIKTSRRSKPQRCIKMMAKGLQKNVGRGLTEYCGVMRGSNPW